MSGRITNNVCEKCGHAHYLNYRYNGALKEGEKKEDLVYGCSQPPRACDCKVFVGEPYENEETLESQKRYEESLMKEVMNEVKASISKIDDEEKLEGILIGTHGLTWGEALDEYHREEESEKDTIIRAIIIGIFETNSEYYM